MSKFWCVAYVNHIFSNLRFAAGSIHHERAGQPLAGGWKAALIFIQGDLDFFAASLGLPRWNVLKGGCAVCQMEANGPNTWKKFNDPAHIAAMEWEPSSWMAWENRSKNPLFCIPSVTGCSVGLDYLHVKYLGSDQYTFASVFFLMVHWILPHEQPELNLQFVWSRMQQLYQALGVDHRYHYFNRMTMFMRKTGPPKLRGRGAEVKGLCPVILALFQELHNPFLETHRQILCMLKLNWKMESILDEFKMDLCLPPIPAAEFKQACYSMLHLNHLLEQHFQGQEGCPNLFNVTPKHHMLLHLADHCHQISPRLIWNFTGEDSMKLLKSLGASACKGLKPSAVVSKITQHWRYGMHCELLKGK